jgi:hypothetical protein
MQYGHGTGVNKDSVEAVKWYRKAAEQGLALAQYNLGVMYEDGEGVRQDYETTLQWYSKSAQQGQPNAQLNLGNMYLHGDGVNVDYEKAYQLFRQSAMQGELLAIFNIGQMYANGAEVPQSNIIALAHYQIALSAKDRDIDEYFNTLKSRMTPDEIRSSEQEARKLILEYGLE